VVRKYSLEERRYEATILRAVQHRSYPATTPQWSRTSAASTRQGAKFCRRSFGTQTRPRDRMRAGHSTVYGKKCPFVFLNLTDSARPDRCDGTYDANCDPSRAYTNISAILNSFGATDLLTYMGTYWKDYQGNDESFWYHEWAKHGTCISTLEPSCYNEHKATEEVVDYFQKAVDLFKTLPSYTWLAAAGITPSTSKTYTTAQIQSALAANRPGVEVTLGCKSGVLNEIWYHYDVRGSLQTGEFVPADPDGTKSTCPATGIKYLPKGSGSTPPPGTTTTIGTGVPQPTAPPGTPFSGKGYLNVLVNGAKKGCIISKGSWYTTGTCATFTAANVDTGFTLSSSKGKCAIVGGALSCDASVTSGTGFTSADGNLAAGGSQNWSADSVASGSTQVVVYAGADHKQTITIQWQSI
jgi:ribonuclease T2